MTISPAASRLSARLARLKAEDRAVRPGVPASGRAPVTWRAASRVLGRTCLTAFGFSAIINVLMLTGSIYMLQVYDRVLSSGSVPTLIGLFAIVVVLYGFLGFYDFLRARMMGLAAMRLDQAMGAQAFRLWVRSGLPAQQQAAAPGAAPPAQPLRDLETLRAFLSSGAMSALFDAPWVPLYVAVLFLLHPLLGWITVGGAVVTAAIAGVNHLMTRDPIQRTLGREAIERDLVERSRRGAEAIVGMGMEDSVTARWQALRNAALSSAQDSGRPTELLSAASRAFRMLLQSAILTTGAWLVIQGEISGGMIVASSILSGRALGPVDQLIANWRGIHRAALARKSLARAIGGAVAAERALSLPAPEGRIDVTGVTRLAPASGPTQRRPILDDVTFQLEPGDGLGIVGTSGSGKSTLVRMLVGLVPPDRGEVRLDGATLDQWDPARLGRHLGYLPQLPDLLPGNVRDVIARFDPAIADIDVIAAAQLAGIHDLILGLPQGYATEVGGAGGPVLSGGQMQRLGLARAICGMPRLVVLDEPNAHLDLAGDEALRRVIETLRAAGSVVIVVTHRPSAITALNKLLVLDRGRVRSFGGTADVLSLDAPVAAPEPRVAPAAEPAVAATPATPAPGPAEPADPLAPAAAALEDVMAHARPMPRAVAHQMRRLAQRRSASASSVTAFPTNRTGTR